ncbi:testis-specific expressed protein 55 [Sorex fumeus]|uniref:testis-specific expressed protein 55 n=1 Tax=Sorex fumeus TaxID=62283 RepID=UPI0024AC8BDC|nr:testis-specific expressed protein 55 [Sorex fumeus]
MEENLEGSLGYEDSQNDKKAEGDEEMADDETEDTAADQSPQRRFSQSEHTRDVSRDSQSSQKTDQRNSVQMSSGTSTRQVHGVEPGESSRQMSAQLEEKTVQRRSLETEERRASKQSYSPLPSQLSNEVSKRKKSSMVDQRTAEQIRRLSSLVQPKPQQEIDSGLLDQTGGETLANTLHKTNEESELAADQVDHPDFSEQDTESMIPKRENYPEELDSEYKRLYSLLNSSFAILGDEEAQEDSFQTSCKFDLSQIKEKISQTSVSSESDTESLPNLQSFTLYDPQNTSILQVKDESLNQTLPSTSSTLDYIRSKEKSLNVSYSDEHLNDEMSFFRRRFPSLLYEDPYEVSVRYMEKHNILQIFQQITENLVYEKPEDPLSFMLSQV